MKVESADVKRVHFVRMNPGDDILKCLQLAVEQRAIRTGFIMNGFGSVQRYHYHVVADANLPPKEAYPEGERALDVLTITGAVIDGRVHAHIVLSDDQKAEGGHLEEGTTVLTFTMVGILELDGVSFEDWDSFSVTM
jgi:predicted DNA-binding protein with PD1-like motif